MTKPLPFSSRATTGKCNRIAAAATASVVICLLAAPCAVRAQQEGTYEQTSRAVHALHTSPVAPNAPLPTVTYSADQQTGTVGEGSFALQGHVHIVGGQEFEARADSLSSDEKTGIFYATGNVLLHELDTTIIGQNFTFNRLTQQGVLTDSLFNYPPFYVATPSILLSPKQLTATNATISTCPPSEHPEFHITASSVTLNPAAQRVYFKNAKFYLYGTHIFTLKRYSQRTTPNPNQNAVNQPLKPSFGYDSHRGPYVVIDRNLGTESVPVSAEILAPTKRDPSASLSTSTIILLNHNANHSVTQVAGQPAVNPNNPVALVRNFASFPGEPLPRRRSAALP